MKVQNLALHLTLLTVSALFLSSCANPYSSMKGKSPLKLERDLQFMENYKDKFCDIKEMHERNEITNGRCLTLYYDLKGNDSLEDEKDEVGKRTSYILDNPDEFDKDVAKKLTDISTQFMECISYLNSNCM